MPRGCAACRCWTMGRRLGCQSGLCDWLGSSYDEQAVRTLGEPNRDLDVTHQLRPQFLFASSIFHETHHSFLCWLRIYIEQRPSVKPATKLCHTHLPSDSEGRSASPLLLYYNLISRVQHTLTQTPTNQRTIVIQPPLPTHLSFFGTLNTSPTTTRHGRHHPEISRYDRGEVPEGGKARKGLQKA
jgi:hypothetical protein